MIEFTEIDPSKIKISQRKMLLEGRRIYDLFFEKYSLLTNTPNSNLETFRATVEEYTQNGGAAEFLIAKIAPYVIDGRLYNTDSSFSVWVNMKNERDLGDFFRIYEAKDNKRLRDAINRITNRQSSK